MVISNERLKSFEALITCFRKLIAPLPALLKRDIENYFNEVDSLILASRAPRFLIFGQRGVGKSSLINAIFGANKAETGDVKSQTTKAEWFEYEQNGKILEILDTRGLLEPSQNNVSGKPSSNLPEKTILDAVRKTCPDVALFLCQAKQVNSGIDQVLAIAEKILKEIKNIHQRDVRLIGVVTQCDLLSPSYILQLPTDNARKNNNIKTAVVDLTKHLSAREFLRNNLVDVIPVAACAEFHEDGSIDPDFRWNIDYLLEVLFEQLPKEAQNEMVRLAKIKKCQKSVASTVVKSRVGASGLIAGAPIPIPSAVTISLIQVAMVAEIAYISGEDCSLEMIKNFLENLGVKGGTNIIAGGLAGGMADFSWDNLPSLISQSLPTLIANGMPDYIAQNFLLFLPGLGAIIGGFGAATATDRIGKAAIAYFIDKIAIEEVKQQFSFALA